MRDAEGPYQIAFVGPSGSGKTTLVERLVPLLQARGLRVGIVKHTHHLVDMDREGKDSWRYARSGALRTLLVTPERTFLQLPPGQTGIEPALLAGLDLVIHEGGRGAGHPLVLVGHADERRAQDAPGPVVASVGASANGPWPAFDRDSVEEVAAFVAGLVLAEKCGRSSDFEALLERSAASHGHLCPGQVLGVRMTLRALQNLGLSIPPPPKRLLAVAETDRCAVDAIASVTGCSVGKRSLRLIDYGKMAATYADLATGQAVRVAVRDDARDLVTAYAPAGLEGHEAQAAAYRVMPEAHLLSVKRVALHIPEADLPGARRARAACAACGEHVGDGFEVVRDGRRLCRPCSGDAYYTPL